MDEQTKRDLNWGADKRPFPDLVAFVQKHTQITWLPHTEPPSITLALFPPSVIVQLPLLWAKPAQTPFAAASVRPSLHFRIGWRRDMNSGEYYLGAELKRIPRQRLW